MPYRVCSRPPQSRVRIEGPWTDDLEHARLMCFVGADQHRRSKYWIENERGEVVEGVRHPYRDDTKSLVGAYMRSRIDGMREDAKAARAHGETDGAIILEAWAKAWETLADQYEAWQCDPQGAPTFEV